ncbi:MAG: RNA 2',3'-cyclic phosphodiesterase [Lachnospiraceae bacterium]|nr:RNA 2',3'-cyclic phosphodiesterase [Lachnospiraceae bacterium]
MRLFVAAELSDEMKNSAIQTMHEMKKAGVKGSFVPKQNLHVTLAFIGEVDSATEVKEALKTVSVKPFRLSFTELGHFGDLIWVGVKGNQGLSSAVRSVREAFDRAGIDYDRKKFEPHITLIRKAAGPWQHAPAPKGDMMVNKISLMKSERRDGKQVYTEVMSV